MLRKCRVINKTHIEENRFWHTATTPQPLSAYVPVRKIRFLALCLFVFGGLILYEDFFTKRRTPRLAFATLGHQRACSNFLTIVYVYSEPNEKRIRNRTAKEMRE